MHSTDGSYGLGTAVIPYGSASNFLTLLDSPQYSVKPRPDAATPGLVGEVRHQINSIPSSFREDPRKNDHKNLETTRAKVSLCGNIP